MLPTGTLLDGEIVIADELGRSDFGALQHRMSVAKRASAAAALERPAVLLVFDLLRLGDTDLTGAPFCERRDALEQLVAGLHPCLQLVQQTADIAEAEDWLNLLPIEGVVAKRADGCYLPGRRNEWVKVKRQRTADCVVIGITAGVRGPALVLGLRHADGELHHFGVTQPVSDSVMTALTPILNRAGPEESAIRSRWQHDAVPPWRRLPAEVVCEVSYTTLDAGDGFASQGSSCAGGPPRGHGIRHVDHHDWHPIRRLARGMCRRATEGNDHLCPHVEQLGHDHWQTLWTALPEAQDDPHVPPFDQPLLAQPLAERIRAWQGTLLVPRAPYSQPTAARRGRARTAGVHRRRQPARPPLPQPPPHRQQTAAESAASLHPLRDVQGQVFGSVRPRYVSVDG